MEPGGLSFYWSCGSAQFSYKASSIVVAEPRRIFLSGMAEQQSAKEACRYGPWMHPKLRTYWCQFAVKQWTDDGPNLHMAEQTTRFRTPTVHLRAKDHGLRAVLRRT